MLNIIGTLMGILLMFVLYICFLFVMTTDDGGRYSWVPLSQLANKQVTIGSDEGDFVKESQLIETLNTAEIDREVALWNLQIHTAKRVFSDEVLVIPTPAFLSVKKQRSIPGKVPPEVLEVLGIVPGKVPPEIQELLDNK